MSTKRLRFAGLFGVLLLGAGGLTVGLLGPSRSSSGSVLATTSVPTPDGPAPDAPTPDASNAGGSNAGGPGNSPSHHPVPPPPEISYPQVGSGKWTTATGRTAIQGHAGRVMRFQVAVEEGVVGIDPQQFAAEVLATLGDSRGWTAGGQFRFQRVGPGEQRDFTVYLATPATRDALCGDGYDRYTSCRNGARVVLNVARWANGVPHYGADLIAYRAYLVNHEVGHRLGHGHELCPGKGRPAPVMQQQTLGLHGCVANPWVYLGGHRHAGRSGAYDDPVPPA
ncbi:DUF3152 domain-containing protein [Micromonospora sp. NPDC003197]